MRRIRWLRVVVVLGLAGALVGVVPDGVSAAAGRARCRATAFVTNSGSGTVSTIDTKTRTKNPTDITVGSFPDGVAVTRDGKMAFVANRDSNTVSTIDVKTRTKNPIDSPVGPGPISVAIRPWQFSGVRRVGVRGNGPAGIAGVPASGGRQVTFSPRNEPPGFRQRADRASARDGRAINAAAEP
jgi:YVTN family beta-propeller protein